jgi:hypothetical protein
MSFYSLSDKKVTEIMEINSAKRAEAR